jgi:RNA polymerase sigma factor for flagellar operon FliA
VSTVSNQATDVDLLWRRFKAEGTTELRNKLTELYLPIVKYSAERLRLRLPDSVDVNDLISAGMFGLMDAIEKFDLGRNIKFETYCSLRIRGAIIDELRHCDWIPRSVRTKSNQINNAMNYLKNELGREPSDEELAIHLEISQEELQLLYKEANTSALLSFDQATSSDNQDSHMADFIKSKKNNDPSEILAKRELKELLIKDLLDSEKQIIVMYYFDELTMQEIGKVLDVTESRVSQIHAKLLVKLRSRLSKLGYGGK